MKIGNKVRLKADREIYLIHHIIEVNGETLISLGLKDYPDIEQDYYINIKDVEEL